MTKRWSDFMVRFHTGVLIFVCLLMMGWCAWTFYILFQQLLIAIQQL